MSFWYCSHRRSSSFLTSPRVVPDIYYWLNFNDIMSVLIERRSWSVMWQLINFNHKDNSSVRCVTLIDARWQQWRLSTEIDLTSKCFLVLKHRRVYNVLQCSLASPSHLFGPNSCLLCVISWSIEAGTLKYRVSSKTLYYIIHVYIIHTYNTLY